MSYLFVVARSQRRAAAVRPRARHVPRQDRRGGPGQGGLRAPAASLYAGAGRRDAARSMARRATPAARRRAAEPDRSRSQRVPVLRPLSARTVTCARPRCRSCAAPGEREVACHFAEVAMPAMRRKAGARASARRRFAARQKRGKDMTRNSVDGEHHARSARRIRRCGCSFARPAVRGGLAARDQGQCQSHACSLRRSSRHFPCLTKPSRRRCSRPDHGHSVVQPAEIAAAVSAGRTSAPARGGRRAQAHRRAQPGAQRLHGGDNCPRTRTRPRDRCGARRRRAARTARRRAVRRQEPVRCDGLADARGLARSTATANRPRATPR